ncbi:hypothetical protein DFQ10_10834 [Winogradskyella eximia]|uniref:Uncharacterized protein n=1 Tax=Winogradskyella eximia TaxID=262006 RepID=A0A3D9GZF3_9FLAO|nr:hypothetical protein [Winogradskyella eximia]RED42627.1 hypothetical protein DFQ10_10834 [Winogradskyella eximia]
MKYNKYGLVAIDAVKTIAQFPSPNEAWDSACMNFFNSNTSQSKSCPKNAFLGLCEEGLIRDIEKGNYTRSKLNKSYALKALEVLRKNNNLVFTPKELWKELKLEEKIYNSQLDVVIALWYNNYLVN